jgi:hypothetical protein
LLPFGQQPNGRTYLAFKFHRKTTRTREAEKYGHGVRQRPKPITLPELEFSTRLIKLVVSFLTNKEVLVEGELSTPRGKATGVPQLFLYLYISDYTVTLRIRLAFFADDTYLHETEKYKHRVLSKLQSCAIVV